MKIIKQLRCKHDFCEEVKDRDFGDIYHRCWKCGKESFKNVRSIYDKDYNKNKE